MTVVVRPCPRLPRACLPLSIAVGLRSRPEATRGAVGNGHDRLLLATCMYLSEIGSKMHDCGLCCSTIATIARQIVPLAQIAVIFANIVCSPRYGAEETHRNDAVHEQL